MRTFVAVAICLWGSAAAAQDIHHHVGSSAVVDQFYSQWLAPNRGLPRVSSCCNKMDCSAAHVEFKNGHWYGRRSFDTNLIPIPDGLIESNQGDPRKSPDGASHICISTSGTVLCAVLGGGT